MSEFLFGNIKHSKKWIKKKLSKKYEKKESLKKIMKIWWFENAVCLLSEGWFSARLGFNLISATKSSFVFIGVLSSAAAVI